MSTRISPFDQYAIRDYHPDDAAALFVLHAAIASAEAGQLMAWTQLLEERLEAGGRIWLAAQGKRLMGYAAIDPLPGLPGLVDLSGGVAPAWRRRGVGARLLRHVETAAAAVGVRQLSCWAGSLQDETARFLLGRGFYVEHEECLLELADLRGLPVEPVSPTGALVTYPLARAVAEFCRLYERSFDGLPWSQPYSEAEVTAMLARPEDLLFLVESGEPVGVVWHERLPDGRGRVEPLGIAREHQGRGRGRRLLLAALHSLRWQGAGLIEIGLWRRNDPAMNLYQSLGFVEAANWYYLARDLARGA
jgi:ribosomal protein S18 acetylase RimI-like enzyme